MESAFLAVARRQLVCLSLVMCLCGLAGCGSAPPSGPPALSADQEKVILDRVNQSQSQESNAPQPTEPAATSY